MRGPGQILIVSCYESGHPPLAAATALAFLERAGYRPAATDLAVDPASDLDDLAARPGLRLVAISVPMHTALRVGVRAAARIRRAAPQAHVCFFGLYATLNERHLLETDADSVLGGEIEDRLVALADALERERPLTGVAGLGLAGRGARPWLERLAFPVPARAALPSPVRYARLEIGGERRLAAAVEASRGCLHLCRHCPIPPVYGGRFFVVPREVVLEDLRGLARQGVRHVTFADPDFFNGPGHVLAIVREMHRELPDLTFDVTTKIENVLRHRERFAELAALGCLFVVSAVESLSDTVLGHLDKGHTRRDVFEALRILRGDGIALRPSLVAFTPWTTLEDYADVLDWVEGEGLVDHVDTVQYTIRLLVPPGSPLATLEAMRTHLRGFDPGTFTHVWVHPDPRLDRLHEQVSTLARRAATAGGPSHDAFRHIREAARAAAGLAPRGAFGPLPPPPLRVPPPRLTEPWFC